MSKIKVLGNFGFLVFFRDETKEVFGFRKHAKKRKCRSVALQTAGPVKGFEGINDGINVKNRQSERAIPKKVVSLQRKV